MGTENSHNDEWLELFNPGGAPVNLDNWIFQAKDGTPFIKLSGTIEAESYFLLERTDDASAADIPADLIYKGGLSNQGEYLLLLDDFARVVDEIDCSLGWFAGNNENKKTMERIDAYSAGPGQLLGSDPDNWKTSQKSGGTPKSKNSPAESINPKKELVISAKNYAGSSFGSVLGIGLGASSCVSVIFSARWLKIRKKSSKMKA